MSNERLARLNAKTQSFTDTGGGFDGMTTADIAASLAGLTPIQTMLVYRRFINDDERGQGYMELWKNALFKIEEAGKLPKVKNMTLDLFQIALDDYLNKFRCPVCDGKSILVLDTGQVHKCRSNRCVDGRYTMYDKDRARLMNVTPLVYSRQYKPAYAIISDYLTRTLPEAESAADRHIHRRGDWRD